MSTWEKKIATKRAELDQGATRTRCQGVTGAEARRSKVKTSPGATTRSLKVTDTEVSCERHEDVPFVVELEVAVPRLIPALRWVLGVRQDTPTTRGPS